MRPVRQIVLLVMVLLLSGGPSLRALAQTGCAPQRPACTMCARGQQRMHCMEPVKAAAQVVEHARAAVEMQAIPETACFCVAPDPAPTVAARPATLVNGEALFPVLVRERTWWPPARSLAEFVPEASHHGVAMIRVNAPLPLRV